MEKDLLKLDAQLCFPLYACSREIIKKYRPFLEPLNLTYTKYIVMLVLWEQDGLGLKDIGERLFLDSGTLTPLLKSLEEQGLITRARDERDERSVVVRLTRAGRSLKEKAVDIPNKMARCMNLTEEEFSALYKGAYKILGR